MTALINLYVSVCKKILLIISMVTLSQTFIKAQNFGDSLRLYSEKKYDYNDHIIQMYECKNTDVLVISAPNSQGLVVQRQKINGASVWDSSFIKPQIPKLSKAFTHISEDVEGAFYLFLNTDANVPMLLKLDSNGRIIYIKDRILDNTNNKLFVLSVFENDSTLSIYGMKNGYFCQVALNKNGKIESEELYEIERGVTVTDIAINSKKEALIIGKKGYFDKYGGGPSTLIIQKINYETRKLATVFSINGKDGRICQLKNSEYAIAYNSSITFPKQDINLALLSKEFQLKSNSRLFQNKIGVGFSFIQNYDDSLFVVLSIKNFKNTLLLIDYNGNIRKEMISYSDRPMAIQNVFINNDKVGYLYNYVGDFDKNSPQSVLKTKLIFYSVRK